MFFEVNIDSAGDMAAKAHFFIAFVKADSGFTFLQGSECLFLIGTDTGHYADASDYYSSHGIPHAWR